MNLTWVPKEPDKAYVADRLWLPKKMVRPEPVKTALEFKISGQVGVTEEGRPKMGQVVLSMWEESSHHIICPREFLPATQYPNYRFPFVDLRPEFQKVAFKDLVKLRDDAQVKAWAALSQTQNGILNLACGKGKTRLALKYIAARGVPTLIVVPDGGILEQWKESIYGNRQTGILPSLEFDGELGLIQGPVFNWAKPITLALITTLALRIRDGNVPEELFRYFGLIVYDEIHILGAPVFSLCAPPFYGDRLGLTATVKREDGMDPIFRYHIGEPFYSDLSQDLIPKVYFQQTPARVNYEAARNDNGITNISLLRVALGRDLAANTYRYWCIKQALDAGRKILVLSHSKDQLRLFHAMFPGSGLIIGEVAREKRMEILRNSQICFAIARLGTQGVDDDKIDTLFYLTPFKSKTALQQSMGRTQRKREGKRMPIVTMFEDWLAPPLKTLCQALKSTLREWKYHFDVVKPLKLPEALPPEVQAAYDQVARSFATIDVAAREDDGGED
jgi:superfamily II DNA or RNA helicase